MSPLPCNTHTNTLLTSVRLACRVVRHWCNSRPPAKPRTKNQEPRKRPKKRPTRDQERTEPTTASQRAAGSLTKGMSELAPRLRETGAAPHRSSIAGRESCLSCRLSCPSVRLRGSRWHGADESAPTGLLSRVHRQSTGDGRTWLSATIDRDGLVAAAGGGWRQPASSVERGQSVCRMVCRMDAFYSTIPPPAATS